MTSLSAIPADSLIDLRGLECPMPSVHLRLRLEKLRPATGEDQTLCALLADEKSAQNVLGFLKLLARKEAIRVTDCRPWDGSEQSSDPAIRLQPQNWLIVLCKSAPETPAVTD